MNGIRDILNAILMGVAGIFGQGLGSVGDLVN